MSRAVVGRPRRGGRLLVRVAVRAAIVAGIVLIAGAFAARASIEDAQLRATRVLAASQAENILAETQANTRLGGDFGALPYELVGSNGAVVASSDGLKEMESSGPLMPVPAAGTEQIIDATYEVRSSHLRGSVLDGTGVASGSTLSASAVAMTASPDRPGGVSSTGTYRVYVFVTPTAAAAAVADLDRFIWPGVALAVLLVAGAAASAARSSLRIVEHIRLQAGSIDGSEGDGTIDVPRRDRELADLATTLNGLVGRLQAAREGSRRFAADAAHELRTPISSLVAALEIASHYPEQIDARSALQHALTEARRVQHLALDLLDSAGSAGAPPDITPIATDVLAAAATHAMPGGFVTTVDLEGAVVEIDLHRATRALENVLRNAGRHAKSRIEVLGIRSGPQYRLRIVNDGATIPSEEIERIFEPFARLDEARNRDAGGSGLGLAIARRDIEQIGGTLRARLVPKGAEFEFLIPLAPASTDKD